MEIFRELHRVIDNTFLRQDGSMDEIESFISRSIEARFRTVVVPPWAVSRAVAMTEGTDTGVSAVIGFPLGYHPLSVKLYEIEHYLNMGPGVTDFDVVVNVSAIKSGMWDYLKEEISALASQIGTRIFKLIIETPLLTEEEIRRMADICSKVRYLDYVKTGSGFAGSPTTEEQVRILAESLKGRKRIKVSGGVRTMADLERFLIVGGDVFGTSSGIAIMDEAMQLL
ncbi:deoxyribose-phosphate aldolase [Dethiosulfovibrio salsuginis]|uniref:Deoxyribose-phosphate aldolase n=1 Tax=Dethiosulfovibrio salsuginis TaxID=561720 RepID=A0A1X7KXX2_9BACT|nr:deoxyribose-phosphate aldolase [Dethiosulfovibrio salsuginis]SMG45747.1 deoxyribose-phosphate aldolase [Dethiosulfovibrio salsuginis]